MDDPIGAVFELRAAITPAITTGSSQTHAGPDLVSSKRAIRHQPSMLMATTRNAHPNEVGSAYQSFVVSTLSPIRW